MTIQELINVCIARGIPFDTPIVLRDKDDFLLIAPNISLDKNPYFGNCHYGEAYLEKHAPRTPEGDVDYDNLPDFLIFYTGN